MYILRCQLLYISTDRHVVVVIAIFLICPSLEEKNPYQSILGFCKYQTIRTRLINCDIQEIVHPKMCAFVLF